MNFLKSAITLFTVSVGAAMLATPASAVPLPTASLAFNGSIDLSSSNGLSVLGDMNAQYRTPPDAPGAYQFNTSLSFGAITINPEITVTTPEIVLIPGGEVCVPIFGCVTTPDVTLPAQIIPVNPNIALSSPIDVYDLTYTSGVLPLGDIFAFDFGTPLLGDALNLDTLLQDQFESGATSVSETGSVVGPFSSSYNYNGVLQPDGSTILGDYELNLTGPGILAELEAAILALINDNTGLLTELALQSLLASDPCAAVPIGQSVCNDILAGLDGSDLGVTVDSIGNFSTDFSLVKSIIPLPTPVPTPASLPLVAFGLALLGLAARRQRSIKAV